MRASQTLTRQTLADFEPLAQRAHAADSSALIRIRADDALIAGFVTLPYDVIAGRTLARDDSGELRLDLTHSAADFIEWMAGGDEPRRKDAHWLAPLPPRSGWQRIERVPDFAIRDVVRSGAVLARSITGRDGQQSLLSSTVLTATGEPTAGLPAKSHDVPLRALTALTKMGFLPRQSEAAVDLAPGWVRVAAVYGSTYVATNSGLLGLSIS